MTATNTAPRPAAPAPRSPAAPPAKNTSARLIRGIRDQWLWVLLAILVVALVLVPILPLQLLALEDGAAGYRQLFALPDLWDVLLRTAKIALGSLIVAMILGVTLALSTHALSPRGRKYLSVLPVLPLVIPAVAHVIGFVFLFSPENGYINALLRLLPGIDATQPGPLNVYTELGIVLYTGVNLTGFVYLFVYNGLTSQGMGYALAARVNGAGGLRTLLTVTIPLLRPQLVYAFIVALLLGLGQFTAPLLLGRREGVTVLMTRMYELTGNYPVNFALVAAMGAPLVIMAVILVAIQRRVVGNQNRFVGQVDMQDSASRSRVVRVIATAHILLFTFLSAVLPILSLLYVSLSPYWRGEFTLDNLTVVAFEEVFKHRQFMSSITTSLIVTIVAVALVIPLGMLIAFGIYNRDKLWTPIPPILDFMANIPMGVPAALMGFGFLFVFASPPLQLYGTYGAFIIAFLTIMIPYSVRYQLATLIALGSQTIDAARVGGAGPLRTFAQIIFPLARGGIASSAAIMFVLLIHEFGVSLLLRSPRINVMSVVLFEQYDSGSYPRTAVMALVMTVLTAIGLFAAMAAGGSRALERL